MNFDEVIQKRRSLRTIGDLEIDEKMIRQLSETAKLAPSCFNKQPWRYVFVYEKKKLEELQSVLAKGNEWAKKAPLIVAVLSEENLDCVIKTRKYYQFDTGISTGFLILKATEMGLVAHPIAGFSPSKTKKILEIPKNMEVITLIIFGKLMAEPDPDLNEEQARIELERPPRLDDKKFVFHNSYEK